MTAMLQRPGEAEGLQESWNFCDVTCGRLASILGPEFDIHPPSEAQVPADCYDQRSKAASAAMLRTPTLVIRQSATLSHGSICCILYGCTNEA